MIERATVHNSMSGLMMDTRIVRFHCTSATIVVVASRGRRSGCVHDDLWRECGLLQCTWPCMVTDMSGALAPLLAGDIAHATHTPRTHHPALLAVQRGSGEVDAARVCRLAQGLGCFLGCQASASSHSTSVLPGCQIRLAIS